MVFAALARRAAQQYSQSGARAMGSAASGRGVTYGGVTVQPPSTAHVVVSEVMGGLLWSWLLIRLYEDGDKLIFGHASHFEHELHEMQHGDHAGDGASGH